MLRRLAIDWDRISEKPEKAYKVEGRFLLDLRTKINDLEQQLKIKTDKLDRATNELNETKEKLTGREKSLSEKTEELSAIKKELGSLKEEKEKIDKEVVSLKSNKSDLEKRLSELESLKELESKMKDLQEDMEQRERELEGVKKDLQQTISDKYVEIESLKNDLNKVIQDKEEEIVKSKNESLSKEKEVEALHLKIKSLEDYIAEAKGAPQVIEEIKELMAHNGFLSDKELEESVEKNLNK